MNESPVEIAKKITALVHEIKRREHATIEFQHQRQRLLFPVTALEAIYLQYRKILELTAFSVVLANSRALHKLKGELKRDYHADRILKRIEKSFPASYPQPIVEVMDPKPGIKASLQNFEGDYLTRSDFTKLYTQCGDLLHSRNPFRKPQDLEHTESQMPIWGTKLRGLLNKFTLRSANEEDMFLLLMNTNNRRVSPTVHPFKRLS